MTKLTDDELLDALIETAHDQHRLIAGCGGALDESMRLSDEHALAFGPNANQVLAKLPAHTQRQVRSEGVRRGLYRLQKRGLVLRLQTGTRVLRWWPVGLELAS